MLTGESQALAELSEANKYTYFNALYTRNEVNEETLTPDIRQGIPKEEYSESIFDGMYIFIILMLNIQFLNFYLTILKLLISVWIKPGILLKELVVNFTFTKFNRCTCKFNVSQIKRNSKT